MSSSAHRRTNGEGHQSSNQNWPPSENVGKSSRPRRRRRYKQTVRIVWTNITPIPMISPWNKCYGSNAVSVPNPSEILRFEGIRDGRQCGTDSFVEKSAFRWILASNIERLPVRSNAARNVAINRLVMINQNRVSFGVALPPSSFLAIGSDAVLLDLDSSGLRSGMTVLSMLVGGEVTKGHR
jgi:hypothetical protein